MRSKRKPIPSQKVVKPTLISQKFYRKSNSWLIGIILLTALAYLPSLNNELTNWDDHAYIDENPYIKEFSWENIKEMFSEYYIGNYHPLTLLTFNIEYQFVKTSPPLYHINNLLLHLLNTFLVFVFIRILFNKLHIAALVALLFGISPLHVESVAWVSERKDVLYAFFFLASIITYIRYVNTDKTKILFVSILFFVFSLLSKGQAVTLAVSLIAVDYMLGRKLFSKRVIIEKLPFLILALVFGYIAIDAQRSGEAVAVEKAETFFHQIVYAVYAFTSYIVKLIIPHNLSAIYPYPVDQEGNMPLWIYLFLIPFAGIIWFFYYSLKNNKSSAFGLIFYAVNIFLLLQLLPVGKAIMADRYTYIPSIGIFFIIAVVIDKINIEYPKFRKSFQYLIGVYILILSVFTYNRCNVWENSISLWDDVLSKHPTLPQAAYNRAIAREKNGDLRLAIADYSVTINNDPENAAAYNNRGNAKTSTGDYKGAVNDLTKAISLTKNYTEAYYNRGIARIEMKDYSAAINDFDTALSLNKKHVGALNNRGNVRKVSGNPQGAIEDYNKLLEIDPDRAETYNNRGNAYIAMEDYRSAICDFSKAIQLNPGNEEARYNRGNAYAFIAEYDSAIADLSSAININPRNIMAYNNRGNARAGSGDLDGAVSDYDNVIMLNPGHISAYFNRAYIKTQLDDFQGALPDIDMVIKLNPQYVTAYYLRGIVLINLGKDGCDDLRHAYEMGYKEAEKDVLKYCRQGAEIRVN